MNNDQSLVVTCDCCSTVAVKRGLVNALKVEYTQGPDPQLVQIRATFTDFQVVSLI